MIGTLLGVSLARAEPVQVALPVGESPAAWAGPFALVGLTAGPAEGCPGVRLTAGSAWTLSACGADGVRREGAVAAPVDEAGREAVAMLAWSLLAPAVVPGVVEVPVEVAAVAVEAVVPEVVEAVAVEAVVPVAVEAVAVEAGAVEVAAVEAAVGPVPERLEPVVVAEVRRPVVASPGPVARPVEAVVDAVVDAVVVESVPPEVDAVLAVVPPSEVAEDALDVEAVVEAAEAELEQVARRRRVLVGTHVATGRWPGADQLVAGGLQLGTASEGGWELAVGASRSTARLVDWSDELHVTAWSAELAGRTPSVGAARAWAGAAIRAEARDYAEGSRDAGGDWIPVGDALLGVDLPVTGAVSLAPAVGVSVDLRASELQWSGGHSESLRRARGVARLALRWGRS